MVRRPGEVGRRAVADDDRRERVLLHARHRGAPGLRGHGGGLGRRLCDRDRARQGASCGVSQVGRCGARHAARYGEWARRRLESGEQRSCAGVTVLHAEHASGDAPSLVGVAGCRRALRLSQQPGDRGCESGLRLDVIRARQQRGRKQVERIAPGRGFVPPGGQRRAGPRQHRVGQRHGGSGLRGPRGRGPGRFRRARRLAIARDEQPGEQRHEQRQPGAHEQPFARIDARAQLAHQRHQVVAGPALAALDVGAHGRLQEHARAPWRQRLVHEPVDEAVADQAGEHRLVLALPGHHHHHVRELVHDLFDQRRRLGRHRREIDQQHAAPAGQQQVDGLRGRACPPDGVTLADRVTDCVVQREVAGQHDHVHHDHVGRVQGRDRRGGVEGRLGGVRVHLWIAPDGGPPVHRRSAKT